MTDTEKLNEIIEKSGYRKRFIADEIGISYQALQNKITNKTEFLASEIQALCDLLKIPMEDRQPVFFKVVVDK